MGSAAELERRRRRAVEDVTSGQRPDAVTRTFGVARASVDRGLTLAKRTDGLAAKPHPGPASRLSATQYKRLANLLAPGAKARGWSDELWTCARIAVLIQRHFGVASHHGHVGRLLRERLNGTPPEPRLRARERDTSRIRYFK
jgi:transposase